MAKTALAVMDLQEGMVARIPPGNDDYLPRVSRAIAAARTANIALIYVTIAFRAGHPEISSSNKGFSAIPATGAFVEAGPGTAIHAAVAPRPGDVVVTKKRISAFTGSDLAVVLRGLGVQKLVLAGISTSGVVLSTLCEAADLDYSLAVLHDACLDPLPEVHRVLTEKIFPKRADVLSIDEWIASLE